MKIRTRITLLALLALLISAAGCSKKEDDGDDGPNAKPSSGTTKTDSATGKSSVGGFGK